MKLLLRRSLLAVGLFVLVLVGIGGVFERVPGGLVPDEDQGYLIALMTMPDGAAISRTSAVVEKLDKAIMADPLVADVMSFSGMDAVSGAAKTNVATFFFTLKPWGERKAPGDSSFDLARKLYGMGFGLEQGSFIAFNPPPISGMSNTGGFEMWLQDRNGRGSVELSDVAQKLAEAANKRPELQGVSTSFTVNAPQLFVELDREKARTLGVNVSDVFQTMQATFGSSYINDFNLYGRTFRVYTQSEKDYRARPEDLAEVYVRNKQEGCADLGRGRQVHGQPRHGLQFRAGHDGDGGSGQGSAAGRVHHRVVRLVVSGKAGQQRRFSRFRARAGHGLPDPRRAV